MILLAWTASQGLKLGHRIFTLNLSVMRIFNRPELMAEARKAASKHGTKLLLCLGGNGRSGGFSVMVSQAFVEHLESDFVY